MKALSIKQPFAHLVATGQKTLEIRSRKTNFRGDILICSSKKVYDGFVMSKTTYGSNLTNAKFETSRLNSNDVTTAITGHALAILRLVDCREMRDNYEDERDSRHEFIKESFVWVLEKPRLIKPFPVSGKLGLFNVEFPCSNEALL